MKSVTQDALATFVAGLPAGLPGVMTATLARVNAALANPVRYSDGYMYDCLRDLRDKLLAAGVVIPSGKLATIQSALDSERADDPWKGAKG